MLVALAVDVVFKEVTVVFEVELFFVVDEVRLFTETDATALAPLLAADFAALLLLLLLLGAADVVVAFVVVAAAAEDATFDDEEAALDDEVLVRDFVVLTTTTTGADEDEGTDPATLPDMQ